MSEISESSDSDKISAKPECTEQQSAEHKTNSLHDRGVLGQDRLTSPQISTIPDLAARECHSAECPRPQRSDNHRSRFRSRSPNRTSRPSLNDPIELRRYELRLKLFTSDSAFSSEDLTSSTSESDLE